MNLIEQLGGYEKAKNIRLGNEEDWMFYSTRKEWYSDIKHDESFIFIDDLKYQLAQHRRENNIFEDYDKVVAKFDCEPSYLYIVKNISDKGYSYGNDWGWRGVISNSGVDSCFRHATDAEIKAGRRL